MLMSACMSENKVYTDNKAVTKNIETPAFERIEINGGMDIYYTQSTQTSLKVKASEEAMELLEVKVEDKTLIIQNKPEGWNVFRQGLGTVEVYVTSPDIIGVSIVGSGDFIAKAHIDTDNMDVDIFGSGDVEMNSLICDKLSVSIAGSGDVGLRRLTTGEAHFSISGSGDVSVSNANVAYTESSIAGSGSIAIKGKVLKHTESISGSGDVSIEDEDGSSHARHSL